MLPLMATPNPKDKVLLAIFSYNVRRLLEARNKSAYWLTQQMQSVPGCVYPVVRGRQVPSIGTAHRMAVALGVTIDELLVAPKIPREAMEQARLHATKQIKI